MNPIFTQPFKQPLTPAFKRVGGKRRLAPLIVREFPKSYGTYWEPMCGGAAVYALARPARAVLADVDPAVVNVYLAMRDHPRWLCDSILKYQEEYRGREEFYYAERDLWNAGHHTAPRFLFLVGTSFNGLWRHNADGGMNAPWGQYPTTSFPTKDLVFEWAAALEDTEIACGSVFDTCNPKPGDVVFVDPPYVGTFDTYVSGGFTDLQVPLLQRCREWQDQGVTVLYSNSMAAVPLVREHWPHAQIQELKVRYSVNSDGEGRDEETEILVVGRG